MEAPEFGALVTLNVLGGSDLTDRFAFPVMETVGFCVQVTVQRKPGVAVARAFSDYEVNVNKSGLPTGVELIDLL